MQNFVVNQSELTLVTLSPNRVKIHPLRKKNNVSANPDYLVCGKNARRQGLMIRPIWRILLPISNGPLQKFASNYLLILKKLWRFPTPSNFLAKVFRPQFFMILWYNFWFQTYFQTCKSCLSRRYFLHFTVWYCCVVQFYLSSSNYILLLAEVK